MLSFKRVGIVSPGKVVYRKPSTSKLTTDTGLTTTDTGLYTMTTRLYTTIGAIVHNDNTHGTYMTHDTEGLIQANVRRRQGSLQAAYKLI